MSPVGFGIGILMLTYASTYLGRIFSAVFQAIATGTFLYVTFFEIFFHELNSKECHKLLKVLMMILGYALITIVLYFENRIK
jgi:zinc transporter ZupT